MSRFDLDDADLATLLTDMPAYRVAQLKRGLYEELRDLNDISVLPKTIRSHLDALPELGLALNLLDEQIADRGTTRKWLFGLHDGALIETVLMRYERRTTVCVSSQAGCAMACSFCATGQNGYSRHLTTGEIVEQVIRAAQAAKLDSQRLDHVVFMGMGEPFANFDRVWRAVERIVSDIGIGARHVTLSTVGLVPQIRQLAGKRLQVNLAVSLHAANDDLRSELVPINRRYPIATLVHALEEYVERTRRRVSFEWALIDSVNDSPRDVTELAAIALPLRAHVNLIPLNPIRANEGFSMSGSSPQRVDAFARELANLGVNATIRRTRGRSIDAACGQLAGGARQEVLLSPTPTRPAR